MSIKVGILNVAGYVGAELARLIEAHPDAELVAVTGRSTAGQSLRGVLPYYTGRDLTIAETLKGDVDVVFSALPHAASAVQLVDYLKAGVRCIDLSADFRLNDAELYRKWYKVTHPDPALLGEAVYGLTELNRERIKSAKLVACPGCFPTGALLGLLPLLKKGLIDAWAIVDAKTGVSGAGRSAKAEFGFGELTASVNAYGVAGHRHKPEILQEMERLFGAECDLRFVPHLVPMARGILSTIYTKLAPDADLAKPILEVYREFFADEPFITITESPPKTKFATGSNHTFIHAHADELGNVTIITALDNLVKGAAGQAVQNFNLMFGLAETRGLGAIGVYP